MKLAIILCDVLMIICALFYVITNKQTPAWWLLLWVVIALISHIDGYKNDYGN